MYDKTPLKVPVEKSDLLVNFKPGDLLFGLEKEARYTYRPYILAKFEELDTDHTYITIDDINRELGEYIFNPEAQTDNIDKTILHGMVSTHLVFWNDNPNFTITMIKEKDDDAREKKALIYSCKVALLSHPDKIHFCLDNFDIEAIRNTRHKNYKSFTSKELRLCAKKWEAIRHRVEFYDDGNKCAAPWGENSSLEWLKEESPTIQFEDSTQFDLSSDSALKTPRYDSHNSSSFFQDESLSDTKIIDTIQNHKKADGQPPKKTEGQLPKILHFDDDDSSSPSNGNK